MEVIGFLCMSLGSSTVQLHDSLDSRRSRVSSESGFSSQNGDRDWVVYYRRAALCCEFFLRAKNSMQRIFINKCFLFTAGSVCRVKRFTTRSRNSLKDVRKSQLMSDQPRKWLRQQSKDFHSMHHVVCHSKKNINWTVNTTNYWNQDELDTQYQQSFTGADVNATCFDFF
jgi:hypothetical protein